MTALYFFPRISIPVLSGHQSFDVLEPRNHGYLSQMWCVLDTHLLWHVSSSGKCSFSPSQECHSLDPVPPEIAGYWLFPYNTRGHTYLNHFKSGQLGSSRELIINLSWPTCWVGWRTHWLIEVHTQRKVRENRSSRSVGREQRATTLAKKADSSACPPYSPCPHTHNTTFK